MNPNDAMIDPCTVKSNLMFLDLYHFHCILVTVEHSCL